MTQQPLTRIAIFASGTGTNAANIIQYFKNDASVQVSLVACNKPGAGVIAIAGENHIPLLMLEKERFFRGDAYVDELRQMKIGLVVLAGFLWKIPAGLIAAFPNRIINIHPALLPKFGGKGMYGSFVHEAVIAAGEKESGITIHLVDEQYDNGDTIFQAATPVLAEDTASTLAKRIHELEYRHFPAELRRYITEKM